MKARHIRMLLIIAAVVVAWELTVRSGFVSPIIIAAPSDIVLAARKDGAVFLHALLITVTEIGVAIVIAWTLGIVFGLIVGSSYRVAAATAPVLSSIFAIPLIILYPLLMAWLGVGPLSKVVFGVLAGFFPIALNTIDGVRAVDRGYVNFARSIGATRLQTNVLIVLPLALPAIVSGLRVGTGLVVIGVIVTEMLASLGGLGYVISYHRSLFDTGHVYFGMALALLIALGVNGALTRLDRRIGHWRLRQQVES
jgi:NitT/TauT family transport system permease protein/taurine transport system permease protein